MTRHALVLGGGGVAGIAWETGIIAGLTEGGAELLPADLIVGTSAGSVVGAQLASGAAPAELLRRQLEPELQVRELPTTTDPGALERLLSTIHDGESDPIAVRRRLGAMALAADTVPEAERRAVIESRLGGADWPRAELKIVAVDAETGQERVFDAASGVELVDAVAASCAVPGVWPPVTIGGRRYIDGAARTVENADLAAGCERVLVLQVVSLSDELDKQVAALRGQGAEVMVIKPDEAAREALGPNLLDPATRGPASRAGHDQGLRAAATVAQFWR